MRRFHFWSAIFAGFVATVVMTIVMYFFGFDIMKMLGMIAGMQGTMIYIVGGLIHLIVGLVYAVIYALIFEPLFKGLPKFLSGAIYGLLPFILAMTLMGSFVNVVQTVFGVEKGTSKYMQGGGVDTYQCKPHPRRSTKKMSSDANDSFQIEQVATYPCKPHPRRDGTTTEVDEPSTPPQYSAPGQCKPHPRRDAKEAPVAKCKPSYPQGGGAYPCKPHPRRGYGSDESMCEPCGPAKGPAWLWSLIHHVIYGFILGICYVPRRKSK